MQNILVQSGELLFRYLAEENRLELVDCVRNERLWIIPGGKALLPEFAADAVLESAAIEGNALVLRYRSPALSEGWARIAPAEDGFVLDGSFTPVKDAEMCKLDLLPAETKIGMYQLINFRNRHHTDRVWPELRLGGTTVTDTYSTDWQFAPHPTALLLTRNESMVLFGAEELIVGGYGMEFACKKYNVEYWRINFGPEGFGLKLPAGKAYSVPRFRLMFRRGDDPFRAYAAFGRLLVKEGAIADPAEKLRFDWHRDNVYCTWNDQCAMAKAALSENLQEQTVSAGEEPLYLRMLDEAMVWRAVEIIEREKLPLPTILLDEGWSVTRGNWEPHPGRFPNMRKMVDALHARGFRVVVWWNWVEIYPGAEPTIPKHHLIANGERNPHGSLMRDYSKVSTQEEYLKPLFHYLFSSEPGCCDLDGIKTDFQADKVHPQLPVENPAWRGEENYFRHVYELFMTAMRKAKPDAVHIGCAGNYFLAEYIDINRTYDVANSNYMEHVNRAAMLQATTPGTPVVMDMHIPRDNRLEFLRSARTMDASIHIGQIMVAQDDVFSPFEPMKKEDYDVLRAEL